jgi:hypothetical protein
MTTLLQGLEAQFDERTVRSIAQQLGVAPQQADGAIAAALPLLLGALGRNASETQGARSLHRALERDHASVDLGDLLGGLGGLLGGQAGGGRAGAGRAGGGLGDLLGGGAGEAILGHIFGRRNDRASDGLGRSTGLGSVDARRLMQILAPIVMAYLAKRMTQQRMDPGQLGDVLGREREQIKDRGGLGGGLLGAVLDRDGDGDTDFADLIGLGGSLLGGPRR